MILLQVFGCFRFLGEGRAAVLLGDELSLVLALLLGAFRYGFQ